MLIALILASGKGTRLAPLSTEERPKQYLSLITENSLVEDTANRILPIIDKENIFVVTNQMHEALARKSFSYLPTINIILEPEMKETLASITHAIAYISKLKTEPLEFLILPSDHYIEDLDNFANSVFMGQKVLKEKNAYVLYGIKPTSPNTQYGYIKVDDNNKILDFVEKPHLELAQELILSPYYYWNNGIMLTTKELVFNSVKNIPAQYKLLTDFFEDKISTKEYFDRTLKSSFSKIILEHENNMFLVPVNYTWYDVGNFDVLFEILEALKLNNKLDEIKKLLE
ncbi:MAG: sugar phosphate nucleotidyltransferase [Acholeplasma sp.]|nr:sugar phosphate nucleotidyltransferase [Acholeplasma sp.]